MVAALAASLFFVSVLVFVAIRVLPGDPALAETARNTEETSERRL